MSQYRRCRKQAHGNCRAVSATGHVLEIVRCPWCNGQVSTDNPGKWCSVCWTVFILDEERGEAHFGKGLPRSLAVSLAIALEKSGGARMGDLGRGESTKKPCS